jgi:hypothetical protein
MSGEEYFRSNVNEVSKVLCHHMKVKEDNSAGKKGVYKALKQVMPQIFEDNKYLFRKNPKDKVISHLNKKSVQSIISQAGSLSDKSKGSRSVGQMRMEREQEIHGNRRNKVMRNPQSQSQSGRKRQRDGPGMMDSDMGMGGGSFAAFAPFNERSQGEFIRADGGVGSRFETNVNQNEFFDGGKSRKDAANDMEMRMMQLQQERGYQQGGGMGGPGMGGPGMGGPGMGGPGMGGPGMGGGMGDPGMGGGMEMMGYNPNPFGRENVNPFDKRRPTEPNFRLDGTDSRVKTRDDLGNEIDPAFMGMDQSMMMGGQYAGLQNGADPNQAMAMQMAMQQNNMDPNQAMAMMGMQNGMDPNQGMTMGQNMGQNTDYTAQLQRMGQMGQMPQQGGQNDQQIMGMLHQIMSTMNPEMNTYSQVQKDLKTSIANKLDLDPQSMSHMSANEIKKLLKRERNVAKQNKQKYKSDSDSDESDSDGSDSDAKSSKKHALLKKMLQFKEENMKKQKKLNQNIHKSKKKKQYSDSSSSSSSDDTDSESDNDNDTESDSDSDTKPQTRKQKASNEPPKKTKTVKFTKSNNSVHRDTPSSDEEKPVVKKSKVSLKPPIKPRRISQLENDTEQEKKPAIEIIKKKAVNMNEAKKEKTHSRTLIIRSNEIEENPSFYHDYLLNFEEHYDDLLDDKFIPKVKKIVLEDININLTPKITKQTNTFVTLHDDKPHTIKLAPADDYTIEEIVDGFNEEYETKGNGVIIKEKNGFVTIEQVDKELFDIDCSENSIAKLLGFKKKKYSNASKYTAEAHHAFNTEPIFLYIINIDEINPFAKINPNGKLEQYITNLPTPVDLDLFVIQFKCNELNEDQDDKDFANLGDLPHTMTMKLETA